MRLNWTLIAGVFFGTIVSNNAIAVDNMSKLNAYGVLNETGPNLSKLNAYAVLIGSQSLSKLNAYVVLCNPPGVAPCPASSAGNRNSILLRGVGQ